MKRSLCIAIRSTSSKVIPSTRERNSVKINVNETIDDTFYHQANRLPTVHIAGSNGKESTIKMLATIL